MIVQLNIGGMRSTQTAGTSERYRHSFHLLHIQYIEVGFADPHQLVLLDPDPNPGGQKLLTKKKKVNKIML
jgi:hypothetical protein